MNFWKIDQFRNTILNDVKIRFKEHLKFKYSFQVILGEAKK